jgi:hypothetical protein
MARLKVSKAQRELELTVPKFLSPDGAWCWFADPRAVYYEGKYNSIVLSLANLSKQHLNHKIFVWKSKLQSHKM